ncbi:MAG: S9 family peptidase [Phycisphaerae bacterium]|nr:S9 family peptidase [Phycisphaerae bacterium]
MSSLRLALVGVLSFCCFCFADVSKEDYRRADNLWQITRGKMLNGKIKPSWLDSNQFWYRKQLAENKKEFILVDVAEATKVAAFDHEKLAAGLAVLTGKDVDGDNLPFDTFDFVDSGTAIEFVVGKEKLNCNLSDYKCVKIENPQEQKNDSEQPRGNRARRQGRNDSSPERQWRFFVRDHNLFVRENKNDATDIGLTDDGNAGCYWADATWSPDSKKIIAYKTTPGDNKEVYTIESSPKGGGRAILHKRRYDLPGDELTRREMFIFDLETKDKIKVQQEILDFGWVPHLFWKDGGAKFWFTRTDRGHQRFRVVEVDTANGSVRNIVDEKTETFINSWNRDKIHYLDNSNGLIWASEKDGYNHLYLVDGITAAVTAITSGDWVVRGIDSVDEEKRQIYFNASGVNAGQDPYLIHYYRINFDGSDMVALTEGNGNHSIQYSPDRQFIIDTYSRIDSPPVHNLRKVVDGSLVCQLEQADISDLLKTGWQMPEVFSAKGRDGKTDIWGIVCRPTNFDPVKKYPIIEYIYAGPHSSFVPKNFSSCLHIQTMAELGFIVVQCDGMGTSNRGKAFHDVCWHNLADSGFPDRIAWMKALAAKYDYVDVSRVGIYGGSAGGQSSTGALLFHPEFYKVAVSACGCHDNRMDKASWNEQWMGYPVGDHYAKQSNVTNAHKLKGRLMLIVGELDTNVPPESTLRVADALIKAGKEFELVFLPGAGHGDGGSYGERKRRGFFIKHLLGVDLSDWNK